MRGDFAKLHWLCEQRSELLDTDTVREIAHGRNLVNFDGWLDVVEHEDHDAWVGEEAASG